MPVFERYYAHLEPVTDAWNASRPQVQVYYLAGEDAINIEIEAKAEDMQQEVQSCLRELKDELSSKVSGNFMLSLRMTAPSFQSKVRQFVKRVIAPFKCAYPNPERVKTIESSIYPEQKFHMKLFALTIHSPDQLLEVNKQAPQECMVTLNKSCIRRGELSKKHLL